MTACAFCGIVNEPADQRGVCLAYEACQARIARLEPKETTR